MWVSGGKNYNFTIFEKENYNFFFLQLWLLCKWSFISFSTENAKVTKNL